jgi:hypothetical protein
MKRARLVVRRKDPYVPTNLSHASERKAMARFYQSKYGVVHLTDERPFPPKDSEITTACSIDKPLSGPRVSRLQIGVVTCVACIDGVIAALEDIKRGLL